PGSGPAFAPVQGWRFGPLKSSGFLNKKAPSITRPRRVPAGSKKDVPMSAARTHANHEGIKPELGNLPPQVLVAAESDHAFVHFLEIGILRADLLIRFGGRLVTGLQDTLRERTQLRSVGNQPLDGAGIPSVVFADHPVVGSLGRRFHDRLITFREGIPFLDIDEIVQHRAAFPPTRVIVVFGDLVEAELFVVIRSDPFGCVDRAFLESRINVAAGNLLGDSTHLTENLSGETRDTEFESLYVVDGPDLLSEPAAHLRAGISSRERYEVVFFEESVGQIECATKVHP